MTTKAILLGQDEDGFNSDTAWDNAPPRINYALTLPGSDRPGIYFQMSEQVDTTGLLVSAIEGGKSTTGITALNPSESHAVEFLIPLNDPYTAAELAAFPRFTITNVKDRAEEAKDLKATAGSSYAYKYPSPKYPRDYTYSEYEFVRGYDGNAPGAPETGAVVGIGPEHNQLNGPGLNPPQALGVGIHRVTDALVSIPPKDGADKRYFVWPVWARYTDPANPDPVGNDFWGQQIDDTGIIWDFTGKKSLEDRDTTMQVRVNPDLGSLIPVLYYGAQVPDLYFARPLDSLGYGQGNTGLWLPLAYTPPPGTAPAYINMVPVFYDKFLSKSPASPAGSLFTFDLKKDDPGYESGSRLDFVLRLTNSAASLPPDVFAARLDIQPGESIPENWYQLVRPFNYNIRNVTLQRGGVTILNNVINPNNGERTYIRYHLIKSGRVTIQVFTLDGNLVKTLRRENRSAGEWIDSWNGTNNGGRAVARGMYFVRVVGPDIDEIRKVMVVK
jgi:hypothetical protein